MERQDPIRPDLSADEALRLTRDHFGLSLSDPAPLPSDRDQNFCLLDRDTGRRFVLKISHSQEDPEVLDFQNRILEHLGRSGFPSSKVLFTTSGEEAASVTSGTGVTFLARLLTWIPGSPLFQIHPQGPSLLRRLGSFLGGMDRALEDFSHPAQDRELKWDLRHAGQVLDDYLVHVEDAARRILLERLGRDLLERLQPLVPDLRRSVIHGDPNDHNVLVDCPDGGEEECRISGLVDLGDAVRSYTVAEAAIAAAYVMLGKGDPLGAAAQVVEG
jgi:Ser/Thr protein kinase RdoA (MazF antagonist)